jgi:hypothetical protein
MLPAAFDANGEGSDINVAACLADFDATSVAVGFGYFSNSSTDFSGNRHAASQQPNPIPNTTRQSVVFASGSHQRI